MHRWPHTYISKLIELCTLSRCHLLSVNYTIMKLFEEKQTLHHVFMEMKRRLWRSAVRLGASRACFSVAVATSWLWAGVMSYCYTIWTSAVESILVFPQHGTLGWEIAYLFQKLKIKESKLNKSINNFNRTYCCMLI